MGKSKSRFDLNRDWITYGDLIWVVKYLIWTYAIRLGFDLKFTAIRFEKVPNRKTIFLEVSSMNKFINIFLLYSTLFFRMENNADWTVEQWTYMQTVMYRDWRQWLAVVLSLFLRLFDIACSVNWLRMMTFTCAFYSRFGIWFEIWAKKIWDLQYKIWDLIWDLGWGF